MKVTQVPWYFAVTKKLILKNVRGAWRLMIAWDSLGLLDKVCSVRYFPLSELLVPLNWGWYWSFAELSEYEPTTLRSFAKLLNDRGAEPTIFLDCGGHIGLVSHYVDQTCPFVEAIWGFEPNADLFPILEANYSRMTRSATAVPVALSDFSGAARLVLPDNNEDGAYIEADPHGAIRVSRVDDMELPENRGVAMKIDVEGSELAILKGAEATLRNAPFFIILFEAHKDVMRRTGIDPMECVRFINSLRPCGWVLSSDSDFPLALDRPFFDQLPKDTKRDVIIWSLAEE